MANNPQEDNDFRSYLDATDGREVVYCHGCERQWYRDEYGLGCPGCGGDIVEIVSAESDPRRPPPMQRPRTPPAPHPFHSHNPWDEAHYSDPEEDDIEEHVTRNGNSVIFTRTIRRTHSIPLPSHNHRRPQRDDEPDVMSNFQTLVGNLLGPQFQPGQPGHTVFHHQPGNTPQQANRNYLGGTSFTFTRTGGVDTGPRDAPASQTGGLEDISTLLNGLFTQMGPGGPGGPGANGPPRMPPSFQTLFAHLFNPAMAQAGDAVYTQEALDRIITSLMEQHTSSNAPGPATEEAIAGLPKKILDEKMLGPEGTGECCVCMDDVKIGDEVAVLPCSHWFHENCVGIWLAEHNTCPVCRKGIGSEGASSSQSHRI